MPKILFVDDDRYFANLYLEALRLELKEFEVLVCYDAVKAIEHIKNDSEIAAAILDVMMPPPAGAELETSDGNSTGVWILEQCLVEISSRRIAILLFTNQGLKYVKDEVSFLQVDPALWDVRSKNAILATDLPHTVRKMIQSR